MLKNKKNFWKFLIPMAIVFSPLIFASCTTSKEEKVTILKEYFEKSDNKNILNDLPLYYADEDKSINYSIWDLKDWEVQKQKIAEIKISEPSYQDPQKPSQKEINNYNQNKESLEKEKQEIITFIEQTLTPEFLEENSLLLIYDIKKQVSQYFKYGSFEIIDGKLIINAIFASQILINIDAHKQGETNWQMFNRLIFIKIPKKGLTKTAVANFSVNEINTWKDFLQYKKNNPL